MTFLNHPKFLRTVLLADAATCLATGLLTTLGAAPIAGLTKIPAGLLMTAGLSLFPIAAFMAVVATRASIPPLGVWLVIIGNAGWVLGSLWLLVGGAISPNTFGIAFVAMQAIAVAVLAALEYVGLQKTALA